MQRDEVPPFRARLELRGHGGAAEHDRPAGLPDVLGHAQPQVAVGEIVVVGRVEFGTPEDVAFQDNALRQDLDEPQANRCLARSARAGDEEERSLGEAVPVAATGADGERTAWIDRFLDGIFAAGRADVEHDVPTRIVRQVIDGVLGDGRVRPPGFPRSIGQGRDDVTPRPW